MCCSPVAAVAGIADQELFTRCAIEVSPEHLADVVPLIDLSPGGEVRPHELWSDVIGEVADTEFGTHAQCDVVAVGC